ncbi:hypothetical protein NL676_003263 [Syzygium grande]|nr:hypothetical protein NL676_003263 [Syzygium grande]
MLCDEPEKVAAVGSRDGGHLFPTLGGAACLIASLPFMCPHKSKCRLNPASPLRGREKAKAKLDRVDYEVGQHQRDDTRTARTLTIRRTPELSDSNAKLTTGPWHEGKK